MGEPQKKSNREKNKRISIESEVISDRNSLIISQTFSVNAIVGAEQKLVIEEVTIVEEEEYELITDDESSVFQAEIEIAENTTIRQDYTLIYAAPATPLRSPLLMTVIARNKSDNDVLVSIEDDHDAIVEEIVPAHSELALTAQNVNFVRALALEPSQVQFLISVFHPTS
ncbi:MULTISPECIES: hypothetical protein [Lysinibacillus]|uniref:Uncharacterized protein n=1 Tax=Lysinibacillus antri TaxID=2498145 RepID=A0A3S0R5I2_9BACI|nr:MULTISPECIES: hypothetical protein [Lysinibacillus]RUL51270.1 hypothetical protein EK386_12335 [Lysinibacillus antri]TSI05161.1 hypothetical protein FJQ64_12685 [Lysinibacillus sp. BW-2-10]